MKKSTIFVVLLIYLVSFFIVGFLGIGIKSAYSVTYVTELQVTPLPDQPTLELKSDERVENETVDGKYNTFTNTYTYNFKYTKGTTLKFRVNVLPLDSSQRSFEFIDNKPTDFVIYDVKQDEALVFVTFNRKRAAEFRVQSTDGNKTESTVKLNPR